MLIRPTAFPSTQLDPGLKTGLILCGMGGPDGPDAVEPFLRNLFNDPAIFPVPRLLRPFLSRRIARKRAPRVRDRYLSISPDGSTSQLPTTQAQAMDLASHLTQQDLNVTSTVAMRYWSPWPQDAVGDLLQQGAQQFLIVPMYPQYAGATTGSTLQFIIDAIADSAPSHRVHAVTDWHDLPGYLSALSEPVITQLKRWAAADVDPAACAVLYAAHSLPESFIKKGDPYLDQTQATVRQTQTLVQTQMHDADLTHWWSYMPGAQDPLLAFQSRVGPVRWIGPELVTETTRLAAAGCRHLMVQPVSFTCEHIETLHELDQELKAHALQQGIAEFARGPALNQSEVWLSSLAQHLVRRAFSAKEGSYA